MRARTFFSTVALFIISTASAHAQATAIPLLSGGQRQLSLTVQAGYQTHRIVPAERNALYLGLGRFALGLKGRFDLYLLGGISRQRIDFDDTQLSSFLSQTAYAAGAGLSWQSEVPFLRGITTTLAMQGVFFSPRGAYEERITSPTTNFTGKRHEVTYRWAVAQASLFLSKRFGRYELFTGGSFLYDQVDRAKKVSLVSPENNYFISSSEGLYYQSSRVAASFGMSIHLPAGHQLGFELRALSTQEFSLTLGIGQTGSPD